MTNLNGKGGLAVAEVVFFAPALVVSSFVVFRHGFARQLGWFYLVVLSLLRIIGASCLLYSETQNNTSTGLEETIFITSAVGTAPLLLALLGFLDRVHEGMKANNTNVNMLIFRALHLLSLVGLILAIVGGTDRTDSSSSDRSTGRSLSEAASILFLAMYLGLAVIAIITQRRIASVNDSERKLVWAGVAALPFLLVRIIYTVAVSFSPHGSVFYFLTVDVYISAFMQFLMEALVVAIFIAAGLATPKKAQQPTQRIRDTELGRNEQQPQQYEREEGRYEQQSKYQQPRNLMDYRPSKLIRNALSGR
jgi:hypothetical protein